jgi:hypothetical protein
MSDFETTPLEERMALQVPGQISWPAPINGALADGGGLLK